MSVQDSRPGEVTGPSARQEELATGLARVRARIDAACQGAGRSPAEVGLTVVTKFFPASDVRLLAALGVRDMGENRHQEALDKAQECADLVEQGLRWHFIGGLQSNKAAAVATYADVVESLDRVKLIPGLSRGALERGRDLDVLVQVSLDPPGAGAARSARGGVAPQDAVALAERVLATDGLRLGGVMGVAPRGGDPAVAFAELVRISALVRDLEPSASQVSAGMSGDLEPALAVGATHVRVGSAVLGPRPVNK